jgi:uncharacterized protein YmfQ (DUF2313 family)
LERTQTNGYHREYYSYALYIRLKKMGNQVRYHGANSVDYLKYIARINGYEIKIYYDYSVQYVVKYNDKTNYYNSQDDVIAYLTIENILDS